MHVNVKVGASRDNVMYNAYKCKARYRCCRGNVMHGACIYISEVVRGEGICDAGTLVTAQEKYKKTPS
jgi:hypothetical protein